MLLSAPSEIWTNSLKAPSESFCRAACQLAAAANQPLWPLIFNGVAAGVLIGRPPFWGFLAGSFPSPVRVTLPLQLVGVVAESIQQRVGLDGVTEQRHPFLQGAVAGQHQRAFLIAFVDDVIQVVGLLVAQGLEAKIVDNQKIVAAEVLDEPVAGEIGPGGLQSSEQAQSLDVAHVITAAYRLVSQGQGDVTLAHAHGPA